MVWKSLQPSGEIPKLVTMACAPVAALHAVRRDRMSLAHCLANGAVRALIEEARLTPKPGLVDMRGSGAHPDMDFEMLVRSAHSLWPTFAAIASAAFQAQEDCELRKKLSELGREGERVMLETTNGVNTHRGAIWTLGLLCAGVAMIAEGKRSSGAICAEAARIGRLPDSFNTPAKSHGQRAFETYGAPGARGEAEDGFPHVQYTGFPMLRRSMAQGLSGEHASLNALVAIMADLDDTCILHRGGPAALTAAKRGAKRILDCGGVSTREGLEALYHLDSRMLRLGVSPGGSADLLAAVLFLDFVESIVNSREAAHGNYSL